MLQFFILVQYAWSVDTCSLFYEYLDGHTHTHTHTQNLTGCLPLTIFCIPPAGIWILQMRVEHHLPA